MKKYVCQKCGAVSERPKVYCKSCTKREFIKWLALMIVLIALPTLYILFMPNAFSPTNTVVLLLLFMPAVLVAGRFPSKMGSPPVESLRHLDTE